MGRWQRRFFLTSLCMAEKCLDGLYFFSFVLLPYLMFRDQWNVGTLFLASCCFSDILFHIYCQLRVDDHSKNKLHVPTMDVQVKVRLASQLCNHILNVDGDLGGWMIPPPNQKIHISDASRWLIWAFFGKAAEFLTMEEWNEAAKILDIFKKRMGGLDKSNTYKSFGCMTPNIDAMDVSFRPLLIHAAVAGYSLLLGGIWARCGFTWCPSDMGLPYWIYEPIHEEGTPILFLYGGAFYTHLLPSHIPDLVKKYHNRRIILVSVPTTTPASAAPIFTPPEISERLYRILKKNHIQQVSLISFSVGCIAASWLIKGYPNCVSQLTMVDPVCFEMWDPSFVYNSLYGKPTCVMMHLYHLFTRDHVVTSYLHNFWLPLYVFFPESITMPAHIFIAGRDWLVNGPKTYQYLTTRKDKSHLEHIQLHHMDMTHGEFLVNNDIQDAIFSHL
ncbi:hypothetical protein DSO57_1026748 [Entomophthora muscae]|uniref:Uncharacterized protein n=1 Tax=Entomophthora muscae TaxID=34485 RepID=A0ACC2S3M3_9FUNG|nr:hypothetical protein DSO57_1026748 [Entomophthora muscae]